jgi:hypothetical protein
MSRLRWAKFAGTVGPSTVVVPNVLREHQMQVPLTEDQYAVGEFGSDRTHEPFGDTVRPQATRRSPDHADADIGENSIERCNELTGSISDEKPELGDAIAKIHHQIADLLGGPPPVRVRGRTSKGTDRLPTSSTKTHKSAGASPHSPRERSRRPTSLMPGRAGTAARSCRCPGLAPEVSAPAAGHDGSSTPPRGGRV